MNEVFWARMHGGATHFPIALLLVSVALASITLMVMMSAGYWGGEMLIER